MKTVKKAAMVLLLVGSLSVVFAGGNKDSASSTMDASTMSPADDLSVNVPLKFNLAYGNRSRTMTYNQGSPLTLSNGEVVSAGMLKPTWSYISDRFNSDFDDVTTQDAKASDMIKTASTNNFSEANIYGGNSIAEDLMAYGAQGQFVALNTLMDEGKMPNFKAYLDENPSVKSAITAYDGNVYHVPYIAEIGAFARTFNIRGSWVTDLLDKTGAFDTDAFTTVYEGFYVGANARKNTVTPKEGISITKKTNQSIIEIQNNLSVKNGKTLTAAFVKYINDNYSYATPSELFLGEKAAYDIDELVALFRCIKANPKYLTAGKADVVWPYFTRKSSYREDLLRLATYFDGVHAHGSDSYDARWIIDANGDIQYTYAEEGMYNVLARLGQMNAEGLIYTDCYDTTNKSNFRSVLWGADGEDGASYGFMVFDWIASSTSDTLNSDIIDILPPVAKVNGVWQYYIENTRVIKPDGWAISVAGSTDAEVTRAATVMDYFFSEDGITQQSFGLLMDIEPTEKYIGPSGKEWPKFTPWVLEAANEYKNGDISAFFRDWEGSLMAIGYPKQIGFEYQYTSERGFEAWALLNASTTSHPSYAGTGIKGDNPNYYKLIPPVFSLTPKQSEALTEGTNFTDDLVEYMFNIVKYGSSDTVPQGVEVARSFDEYIQYFNDRGLPIWEATYQTAYNNMK